MTALSRSKRTLRLFCALASSRRILDLRPPESKLAAELFLTEFCAGKQLLISSRVMTSSFSMKMAFEECLNIFFLKLHANN